MRNKKQSPIVEPKVYYEVSGCRQGYGMDADKFYNVVERYPKANSMEEARKLAVADGIWVEKIERMDESEDN